MLKRKIEKYLKLWKETRYGLFVDGARQVGKTYILKKFLKQNFSNVIYINLLMQKDAVEILKEAKNSKDFIFRLSSIIDAPLVNGETVIFIDEIQEFKNFDIVTLTKDLIESSEYRFVFSGSLLGVSLFNVESWPMGYMSSIKMYPLDFEEFLWANNIDEKIIEHVKNSFFNKQVLEKYLYDKFMDLFHKYLLVGGMPDAVKTFVETNDLNRVTLAHETIEKYYKKDISKYSREENKLKLLQMYELIPEEINSKSKRFKLSDLKNTKRTEDLNVSFKWLVDSGVAIGVYNVSEPTAPLRLNTNRTLIKLFFEDVGMLTTLMMDPELKIKLLNKEKDINYGAIYENVVAQLLNSHGFDGLYYYSNKKYGEVDFIVEINGEVLPIEIKSGKDYKRHSALNNLLSLKNYDINKAMVFYNGNYCEEKGIEYYPIFMVEFLVKKNIYIV